MWRARLARGDPFEEPLQTERVNADSRWLQFEPCMPQYCASAPVAELGWTRLHLVSGGQMSAALRQRKTVCEC